jgi:uncharacterized protein (DUF305 family)
VRVYDFWVAAPAILLTVFLLQSAPVIQPGAPGKPGRVLSEADVKRLAQVGITPADVAFMQGMIGHHAQAIEMTDLLKTRTESADMRKLALRIEVSQADEIKMMQHWLQDRGQPLPDPHAHHAHDAKLMPGMLTADDMAKLAAAKGADFDRLFLEYMIKHHQGALVMVKALFASPGAAQDAELSAFARDVGADQQMEIDRMASMLATLKEKK